MKQLFDYLSIFERVKGKTPEEEASFADYAVSLTSKNLVLIAVSILALTLFFWPSDFFIFSENPKMLKMINCWRVLNVFCCLIILVFNYTLNFFKKNPYILALIAYLIEMGGSGYISATVGGVDTPFFYGIYTVPLTTVLLVVDIYKRVIATAGVIVIFLIMFFAPFPEHLDYPYIGAPFVWLFASSVTAIMVGHVVYLLLEINFHQRLALDKQALELQELNSMKNRLFMNISHELRTPLTNIFGVLGSIKKAGGGSQELSDLVETAQRNGARLLGLINELLEIARFESGRAAINKRAVNIEKLIRITASFFESKYQSSLNIVCNLEGRSPVMMLDPEKFKTVLFNLLGNAFKFTKDKEPIVSVIIEGKGEEISITVSDNGPGVPTEEAGKIFDLFYQVSDGVKRSSEGAGVGLTLVKDIVRSHGGSIEAKSEPGKGLDVIITLPVGDAPLECEDYGYELSDYERFAFLPEKRRAEKSGEAAKQSDLVKEKSVLVVEDNDDLRGYIIKIISQRYFALEARGVSEAYELMEEKTPDLIISDLMMPKVSGIEFLKELKSSERYKKLPFIMLTAYVNQDLINEALKAGADDYIPKPFQDEELLLRVKNTLKLYDMAEKLEGIVQTQSEEIRNLAESIAGIQEEERRRIAMEVHDELGQQLTGVRMELYLAKSRIEEVEISEGLRKIIERIETGVEKMNESIDDIIIMLRPPILDRGDLYSAIEDMIGKFSGKTNIKFNANFNIDCEALDVEKQNMLFRIAQESVTNAVKHSQAKNIEISFSKVEKGIRLSVKDDGNGLIEEMLKNSSGFGIEGIKARAKILKGSLTILGEAGRGSEIRIDLPQ